MDSLDRDILRLSLPAIASNVTVPLLGLCDTAVSGHLGSELYLAAIAVGTVMLNVVFWMFGFLRGGTTGLTAMALGAGEDDEVAKVFYRGIAIALSAGVLLIALMSPLFAFLRLVAAPGEEIIGYVRDYFFIRIWGSPAILATMAISGWFVGMQTTFYPMVIAISMNLINIAGSLLLVYVFNMGFSGVALGTLISNWAGLLIAVGCVTIFRRGKPFKCEIKDLFRGGLWQYFKVNGNLFLRSFFIICVTMGVTAAGSRLGPLTLAVNVIAMQFFQFFSFFMDGFAFSGEAIVGLRMGEKNSVLLKKSVGRLLKWTLCTALIFTLVYLFLTREISALLTDSVVVVEEVSSILPYIALIPAVSCWAFIFDGIYIGVTATGKMMQSTLYAGIIFFLTVFLKWGCGEFRIGVCGNDFIWIGFLGYLLVRGVYLASFWKPVIQKKLLPDCYKKGDAN